MTTYYGVWSEKGQEWWWNRKGEVFQTMSFALAKAQAIVVHRWHTGTTWEVCAIGEDGLPIPKPSLTEEQKRIRSEAASHQCEICDDMATNWVELPAQERYFCDRHEKWAHQPLLFGRVFQKPKEQPRAAAEFETHAKRHQCAMCGEPAKEYVDVHVKGWMCEQHKLVKVGCFSKDWRNDYVIKDSRKYVFCDQKECWLGFPMEEENL